MENGFLSEILLEKGYNTYAIGKWHLTPGHCVSAAGPYDRWPLGRGFERYYGFLGGDTHQYYPELVYDNHTVEPEKTPEEGYHLTEDLVDKAISFIADSKQAAPDKPFFMYFAPGAMHAPHHVRAEWADKYKGDFDDGWDAYREKTFARQKEIGLLPQNAELSRHDPDVQDWDSLSDDARKVYARMMEVYAGFLEHTDHHLGRLLDFLKTIDVISDNGASPEGGPDGSLNENMFFNNVPESLEENIAAIDDIGGIKYFNHYPWGWTWAGNTPFRRWKRETYRGGVSDPFLVQWPKGIKARGEVRTQFVHAIDMLPTVLELLDYESPEEIKGVTQSPIEGFSFTHILDDKDAVSKHHTQYFEMFGHRSIFHDEWRAVCPWPGPSFAEAEKPLGTPITADMLTELDATGWELYNLAEDPTENNDLAAENKAKLIELISMWYTEAGKYNVLPIDSRLTMRIADERPVLAEAQTSYTYYPKTQTVPYHSAAIVLNRPHSITADVEFKKGDEGVLLSHGGNDGGYVLYIKNDKLQYAHNYVARDIYHVVSAEALPEGRHQLRYEFEVTGKPDLRTGKGAPGRGQLYVDENLVGQVDIPVTVPILFGLGGGICCGADPCSPVTPDYDPPFEFTGKIHTVTVDVSGELIKDTEAEMRAIMARQ
jgi:arylsulfatase